MAITVNIYYKGTGSAAKQFAREMTESGTVDAIRKETGNLRYEYFSPLDDEETVLLIDSWENQEAIDMHHASPMMNTIMKLREKYNLHMKVERYVSEDGIPDSDKKFILKEDETPTSIGGELRQFNLGGSPIFFQDKASGGS